MPEFQSIGEMVAAGTLLLGSLLMFLAAVGVLRLPDLPTRMHASTKAGSLGAALTIIAVAVFMPEIPVIARAAATVVFLLLTAPVAAHVIGRAGYFVGVPLWEGTVKDALAEQYDFKTQKLGSGREGEDEEESGEVEGEESEVLEVSESESEVSESESEVSESEAGAEGSEDSEAEEVSEVEEDSEADEGSEPERDSEGSEGSGDSKKKDVTSEVAEA